MKVSDSQHRITELMNLLDISQQDIADRTGIDKSTISLYVNGKREPRQDKIGIICDAYSIDPAWFMGYDVPMWKRNSAETAKRDFELLQKYHRLSSRDQAIIDRMMDSMLRDSQ